MEAVAVDPDLLREFLVRYLTEYIYRRVLQALGDPIRDNAASDAEAARLEQQLREHIRALVLSTWRSISLTLSHRELY